MICWARRIVLVEDRSTRQSVTTSLSCEDALPRVKIDPDQVQQVCLKLASNALDAMPDGGVLGMSASVVRAANPEKGAEEVPCVMLEFRDSGAGIASEDMKHVFDPFYTTKDAGRGPGSVSRSPMASSRSTAAGSTFAPNAGPEPRSASTFRSIPHP